jgi:hypothetical protein
MDRSLASDTLEVVFVIKISRGDVKEAACIRKFLVHMSRKRPVES